MAWGFTLVELLVALAILGTLVGLLLPALSAVRSSMKATVCAGNLRQIGVALFAYAADQEQRLPAGWNNQSSRYVSWDDLLAGYDGREVADSAINREYLRSPTVPAVQQRSWAIYGCPQDAGFARGAWVNNTPSPDSWPRTYAFPGIDEGDALLSASLTRQSGLFSGGRPDAVSSDWSAVLTSIAEPSSQILLCEQLNPRSILGRQAGSTCKGAFYQDSYAVYQQAYGVAPAPLHRGQWNYLWVDGHVERRTGASTVQPGYPWVTLPGPSWLR